MSITAREVVEQIQKHMGSPWIHGADVCEAGNPETPISGIATSFTATFNVLRHAADSGHNLIITRERPFWSHENVVMEHSGGSVGPLRPELSKIISLCGDFRKTGTPVRSTVNCRASQRLSAGTSIMRQSLTLSLGRQAITSSHPRPCPCCKRFKR